MALGNTDDATHYLDPATIRKDGSMRKVWELHDLKRRDPDGEMSRRVLVEYDCREDRLRHLSYSFHSEPMTKGKLLISRDITGSWNYIAPDTAGAVKLKFVCSK